MKYIKLFETEEFYLIEEVKKYISDGLVDDYYFKLFTWNVYAKLDNKKLVIVITVSEPDNSGFEFANITINPVPVGNYFEVVAEKLKSNYEEEFEDVTIECDQDDDTFTYTIECYLVEHLGRSAGLNLWDAKLKK